MKTLAHLAFGCDVKMVFVSSKHRIFATIICTHRETTHSLTQNDSNKITFYVIAPSKDIVLTAP